MPVGQELAEVLVAHDIDQGTLYLDEDHAAWMLRELTVDGPERIDPNHVQGIQDAMQTVGLTLTEQAVPEGYTRADESAADPELAALAFGTAHAFSEDYFNEIAVRTLPADLAAQVAASEAPYVDLAWAPAARGFAEAIDEAVDRGTEPSETLRQLARRGSCLGCRSQARARPLTRFVPGHDPATAAFRSTTAPTNAPASSQPAADQPTSRDLSR